MSENLEFQISYQNIPIGTNPFSPLRAALALWMKIWGVLPEIGREIKKVS